MRAAALLLWMAAPSVTLAKPIYLDCTIRDASDATGEQHVLHVILDEVQSRASYSFGESPNWTPATFSPDKVTWQDDSAVSIRRFSLSRITAAFHSEDMGISKSEWDGTCSIPKTPTARKF